MASPLTETNPALAEAIDAIEGTYEFMLAYAAQGRRVEDDGADGGIRSWLKRADAALESMAALQAEDLPGAPAQEAYRDFLEVLRADAKKARAAVRFALAQRTIGSQLIDNLNASSHLRALLTDIFLLDEATKISGI